MTQRLDAPVLWVRCPGRDLFEMVDFLLLRSTPGLLKIRQLVRPSARRVQKLRDPVAHSWTATLRYSKSTLWLPTPPMGLNTHAHQLKLAWS